MAEPLEQKYEELLLRLQQAAGKWQKEAARALRQQLRQQPAVLQSLNPLRLLLRECFGHTRPGVLASSLCTHLLLWQVLQNVPSWQKKLPGWPVPALLEDMLQTLPPECSPGLSRELQEVLEQIALALKATTKKSEREAFTRQAFMAIAGSYSTADTDPQSLLRLSHGADSLLPGKEGAVVFVSGFDFDYNQWDNSFAGARVYWFYHELAGLYAALAVHSPTDGQAPRLLWGDPFLRAEPPAAGTQAGLFSVADGNVRQFQQQQQLQADVWLLNGHYWQTRLQKGKPAGSDLPERLLQVSLPRLKEEAALLALRCPAQWFALPAFGKFRQLLASSFGQAYLQAEMVNKANPNKAALCTWLTGSLQKRIKVHYAQGPPEAAATFQAKSFKVLSVSDKSWLYTDFYSFLPLYDRQQPAKGIFREKAQTFAPDKKEVVFYAENASLLHCDATHFRKNLQQNSFCTVFIKPFVPAFVPAEKLKQYEDLPYFAGQENSLIWWPATGQREGPVPFFSHIPLASGTAAEGFPLYTADGKPNITTHALQVFTRAFGQLLQEKEQKLKKESLQQVERLMEEVSALAGILPALRKLSDNLGQALQNSTKNWYAEAGDFEDLRQVFVARLKILGRDARERKGTFKKLFQLLAAMEKENAALRKALQQLLRKQESVSAEKVFFFVAATLAQPDYRRRYTSILQIEQPYISFSANFEEMAERGRQYFARTANLQHAPAVGEVEISAEGAPLLPLLMEWQDDDRSLAISASLRVTRLPDLGEVSERQYKKSVLVTLCKKLKLKSFMQKLTQLSPEKQQSFAEQELPELLQRVAGALQLRQALAEGGPLEEAGSKHDDD